MPTGQGPYVAGVDGAGGPRTAALAAAGALDPTIEALESLRRSLEPVDPAPGPAGRDRAAEQLRSRVASHLVALRAVRDAEASAATVERVVRRALADVGQACGAAG